MRRLVLLFAWLLVAIARAEEEGLWEHGCFALADRAWLGFLAPPEGCDAR